MPSSPRPPRPDDLYRLRVPTDPRLSPDGGLVVFTVQTATARRDGYRHAIWARPTDGDAPARQLTIGPKSDRHPRFMHDGRSLAFLSDRRLAVEDEPDAPDDGERQDATQVHLLPLDGGEARRLTDLPLGVNGFAPSPDGTQLAILSASPDPGGAGRTRGRRRAKAEPADDRSAGVPPSDFRYIDRLGYMMNGVGFIHDRIAHLWLVDATTGQARRIGGGPTAEHDPAWSPDGTRIAYSTNRRPDHDLAYWSDIHVIDVASGLVTAVTGGRMQHQFGAPTWLPDGRTIAALGHRFPAAGGSRSDIWLFAADGSDSGDDGGVNLSARHDLMPGSSMNSDVTPVEPAHLAAEAAGADDAWLTFAAPLDGAIELWRIATTDGRVERLTEDRHLVSGWDARAGTDGSNRIAFIRSSATDLPEVHLVDRPGGVPRRLTGLNDELRAEIALAEPRERRVLVDGRAVQGWYLPPMLTADRAAPAPLVTEIHGGPHTLYGWAPMWEFQVLAGAGIGVFNCNPRGSEGYGQDFNAANFRDWGPGPSRDVLAGIEALVADGLADPDRLGLTGGSYGGYLTNWIVAHDRRFRAAITCRSVSDLTMIMLTGDISGGEFGRLEFGAAPWDDPDFYRAHSPITHAARIRTPLLIQHAEKDLRTTVGQAEALFTVLRSHRRPVRLMRVPDETHELTRSGTPFRRVENLVQVRDWFVHFLVKGRTRLPAVPATATAAFPAGRGDRGRGPGSVPRLSAPGHGGPTGRPGPG